jgi:hypothetical protein
MPRKTKAEPDSSRVLDYPATMSEYERESLAAEAQLKAERTKPPRPRKHYPSTQRSALSHGDLRGRNLSGEGL